MYNNANETTLKYYKELFMKMHLPKNLYRKITNTLNMKRLINSEKKIILKTINSNIETNILLLCHSLEKGMGVRTVKKGYGIDKATRLIELLKTMQNKNLTVCYVYHEGIAVLNAYIKFQNDNNYDIKKIEELSKTLDMNNTSNFAAGFNNLSKDILETGMNTDFESFVTSKHSMRMFSFAPIANETFHKALSNALYAPSACNRQPCKVYYTFESTKNQYIGKLVPGNKSFEKDIPYYCVITADRSLFGPNELFQWYVNGGIFISYLTLALHSLGIGSCIFQWPDFHETESQLRNYIHINPSEAIIAIIGFGMYPESAKCICAQRKSISDIGILF